MASEWALLRALAAVDVLGPKPGESWSKTVEKIAAALELADGGTPVADKPDVLKRLTAMEVLPFDDFRWLLRLTRALLESQGELLAELGGHACCRAPHNRCAACEALDRAERVRKGEV